MINDYNKAKLILNNKDIKFIENFVDDYKISRGKGNLNILYLLINEYRREYLNRNAYKPKKINYKKTFELVWWYLVYCILLGFLIMIIGIFSWQMYVIIYGVGCVVGYEIFVKPIWRMIK